MDEREITCCFTGHRPAHLPWGADESDARCVRLKEELRAVLEGVWLSGYRVFLCGMALGCDMYFAEAVTALRREHPEIRLEAAIPCGDQAERWALAHRQRYNRLLDLCDKVNVLQIRYTPDCMMKRNRYMADRSSLLIACYGGQRGGTRNTLLYAMREGLKTLTVDIPE